MDYKTILASFMLTIMILVPTKTHASISLPQQVTTQNLALATAVCSTATLGALYKSFEQECSKNQRIKTEGFATFVKKFIINSHVRAMILKKYPAVKIALAASGLFGTATVAKLSHDLLYKSKKIKEKKNKNNKQEHQKVIATLTDEATKVMDAWQTTRQEETTAFNTILKQMEHEKSLALQKEADRKTAEEARQAAERQTAEQTRIQQEKEQRAETERQEAERQAIEQARIQQETQQRILTLTEQATEVMAQYNKTQTEEINAAKTLKDEWASSILTAKKNEVARIQKEEQEKKEQAQRQALWEKQRKEAEEKELQYQTKITKLKYRPMQSEAEYKQTLSSLSDQKKKAVELLVNQVTQAYIDGQASMYNAYAGKDFELLKASFHFLITSDPTSRKLQFVNRERATDELSELLYKAKTDEEIEVAKKKNDELIMLVNAAKKRGYLTDEELNRNLSNNKQLNEILKAYPLQDYSANRRNRSQQELARHALQELVADPYNTPLRSERIIFLTQLLFKPETNS